MKSDSKTLTLGTAIALGLFGVVWLLATRYPNVHMPLARQWVNLGLISALLLAILISAYRSLLRRPGFWLLLWAVFAAHIGFYILVFHPLLSEANAIQVDICYGLLTGVEAIGFALAVVKIYGVGPNVKWL